MADVNEPLPPADLLPLLVVRLAGGDRLPTNAAIAKALKVEISKAIERGLLAEKETLQLVPGKLGKTGKVGKPTQKKTAVFGLTDRGEAALHDASSPEVIVASLRRQLQNDYDAFQKEFRASTSADAPENGAKNRKEETSLANEVAKLAENVAALGRRVAELAAPSRTPSANLESKFQEAFKELLRRIDHFSTAAPVPKSPTTDHAAIGSQPVKAGQQKEPPPAAPASEEKIVQTLREAYRELCYYIEFKDTGLVELPRLYHEAHRRLPSLTVAEFQEQLRSLWKRRTIELHIRNEVRDSPEAEKAIHRDGVLYYYVYWSQARAPQ